MFTPSSPDASQLLPFGPSNRRSAALDQQTQALTNVKDRLEARISTLRFLGSALHCSSDASGKETSDSDEKEPSLGLRA